MCSNSSVNYNVGDYEIKLIETKNDIDEKTELLLEREKELVSEHFLSTMDENTRLELSDNAWLKQEVKNNETPPRAKYSIIMTCTDCYY